jgi:hypothetical protein
MMTPRSHISMTMYSESSSGSSSTSISCTRFGWLSFFMMAISSRIKKRASRASAVRWPARPSWWNGSGGDATSSPWSPDVDVADVDTLPPAGTRCGRRGPLRKMCDCARLRRRVLENSLMAYWLPNWSVPRLTAPYEPRPISSLMMYWLIRWYDSPSSSLAYSDRASSVSLTSRGADGVLRCCRMGLCQPEEYSGL